MAYRIILLITALLLPLLAAPVAAQVGCEVTPFLGYRTGDGIRIDGDNVDRLSVSGGPTFGVTFDVILPEQAALEVIWSRQATEMEDPAGGGPEVSLFDVDLDTFLFNFVFHFAEGDARLRPFLLGGLGFTRFAADGGITSESKFAFDIGGGVKYFFSDRIGLRLDGRYAPTYVKSDPELFCDPTGFCYVLGNPDYFHQVEVTGGVIFRF